MSRIAQTFEGMNGETALISYITCGDPDLETTLSLMHVLVENGTDVIELGVPFSDPMADGSVIQEAIDRALKNKVSLQNVLDLVAEFRKDNQTTPVVLMGYLNPVFRMGYERFAKTAAQVGVDGVLTVDCPVEMADELYDELSKVAVDCIFLITPTTSEQRVEKIASKATGFIYYVSLKGVTGSSDLDIDAVSLKISSLRRLVSIPIGVGFGIKDANSARQVGAVADAVVVGSRLVQTIGMNPNKSQNAVADVVKELKQALQ